MLPLAVLKFFNPFRRTQLTLMEMTLERLKIVDGIKQFFYLPARVLSLNVLAGSNSFWPSCSCRCISRAAITNDSVNRSVTRPPPSVAPAPTALLRSALSPPRPQTSVTADEHGGTSDSGQTWPVARSEIIHSVVGSSTRCVIFAADLPR